MPELTFYPDAPPESTSVDGVAYTVNRSQSWADIIAGDGDNAKDDDITQDIAAMTSNSVIDKWDVLVRAIFLFDTSSLPDDANIVSAILSLYGSNKQDFLSIQPNINIYTSNPASNTAVVAGDFDTLGSTPLCDTPIAYDDWVVEAYNSFELNASGLALISKIGITKLGARNANYDVAGIAPAWLSNKNSSLAGYYSAAVINKRPKLVITYTVGVSQVINKAYALAREEL